MGRRGLLPPFFIPIISFLVWGFALIPYFYFLKLNLVLSDQLISAHYFVVYLILIFSWALSGPLVAAILSFLISGISLYFFLVTKEPVFLFLILLCSAFYIGVVSALLSAQRITNNKKIAREKLIEDYHWAQGEISKKELLKGALEKKIEKFINLNRFSEELKVTKNVESAAQKIVKKVSLVLGRADECALYLVNENRQQLSLAAGESSYGTVIKEKEGSIFDQWVMKNSQGLMIEDARSDFRFPTDLKGDARPLRSVCASPLMTGNKVLGVVRVSGALPGMFNTDDLRLLDIFSSLGAVTLKNLLLYAKMEEMAIHDGLTGLYLKRFFEDKLAEEKRRADYSRTSFSLVLIDIDNFKRYNDDYGHSAGDIVLKNIAGVLSEYLEPTDLAARYGGEEFVALLPNKNKKEARAAAEKLRGAIESAKFVFRRVEGKVTASLGVVTYPEDGRSEEELLQSADRYLYQAKHLGRNRVCGS